MNIIERIKKIFTKTESEDEKRINLTLDLLQEKMILRAEIQAAAKMAAEWRKRYDDIKKEISIIRKRKTYYKKRCILMELEKVKESCLKTVDSADIQA